MASTRRTLVAWLLASTVVAGTGAAQPAPFNDIGLTMGHWHIVSRDVEANKKIFLAMGGTLFVPGGQPVMMFPGLYINLILGTEKGDGATVGSVINHVGLYVDDVQKRVAQWKAAGVEVLPGTDNRLDQAFVVTPDGVRIEIQEDKTQTVPIRNGHIHFSMTAAEIPKAVAWYAKTFGGKAGTRNDFPIVDLPGVQLRFATAETKQSPTRGRILDHIGFDVKDHAAIVKKITSEGITLDEPVRTSTAGNTITYITDPWGTRVELVQRAPLGAEVQAAAGQSADDYRGGWRTDSGEAHTYQFSIRGTTVRGIYCTYCADATTLAFVDGTLAADGIRFEVTHVNADGRTKYKDKAIATFSDGRLTVTGTSGARGGGTFQRVLIKDPRGPDPIPAKVSVLPRSRPSVPANTRRRNVDGADGLPYIQPGPWKSKLTEKDVVGVWLGFGVGAPKQFFIIKKVGNTLRGMVCGTCDNPYTMAALDDFRIEGDTLRFNILHEDWGDGEIPTFDKHVTAHIGWNEMRCTTAADHQPPPPTPPVGRVPGFSLQGPIPIEATSGNVWPDWPPKNTSSPR